MGETTTKLGYRGELTDNGGLNLFIPRERVQFLREVLHLARDTTLSNSAHRNLTNILLCTFDLSLPDEDKTDADDNG